MKLKRLAAYLCALMMLFTVCPVQAAQEYPDTLFYKGGVVYRSVPKGTADSDLLQLGYALTDMPYIVLGETYTWDLFVSGGKQPYKITALLAYQELYKDQFDDGWSTQYYTTLTDPTVTRTFTKEGRYFWQFDITDAAGQELSFQTRIYEAYTAADETDATTVVGKVNQLIAELITPDMSAYTRAKVLHDWLIYNANYDYTYTYYDAQGVLLHGTGVCDSYARAYLMLCTAAGIECMYVSGTAGSDPNPAYWGNHGWNLIKLGGHWYHVDCTWDDPNEGGYERHTYFCVDDETMAKDHRWNRPDDVFKPSGMLVPEAEGGEYEPVAGTQGDYDFTFTTWDEFDAAFEAIIATGERPQRVYGLYVGTSSMNDMWNTMTLWSSEKTQSLYDRGLSNGGSRGYTGKRFYYAAKWNNPTGYVRFNDAELRLSVGKTHTFAVSEFYPKTNSFTCRSSNPAVATATAVYDASADALNVTVTARAGGNATVEILAPDGRGDTLTVTVLPPYEADLSLTLTEKANGVHLTWDTLPGATDYAIVRLKDGVETTLKTLQGTSATLTLAQLPCAVEQSVRVDALRKVNGVLQLTTAGTALDYGYAPVAAEDFALALTETTSGVRLTWNAIPGATEYQLWRATEDQAEKLLTTVTAPSATLTAAQLPKDVTQFVRVVARRVVSGTEYAAWSSDTVEYGKSPETRPAYTPTLTETASGVTLTWDAVETAAKYEVIRLVNGAETVLATVTAPTAQLTVAQLPPEQVQQVFIRAYVVAEDASIFTHDSQRLTYGYTAPASFRPTVQKTASGVKITWQAVPHATVYEIFRVMDGATECLGLSRENSFLCDAAALPANVVQQIYVRAVRHADGREVFAWESTAVSYGAWYVAPEALVLQLKETGEGIVASWNAVPYMTEYTLWRRAGSGAAELLARTADTSALLTLTQLPPTVKQSVYVTCSRVVGGVTEATFSGSLVTYGYTTATVAAPQVRETGDGLLLTWNEIAHATAYEVCRVLNGVETCLGKGTETSLLLPADQVTTDKQQFFVRGLHEVEGLVYFTVNSQRAAYGYTAPVSFLPQLRQTASGVTVSWNPVPYATEYAIIRRYNGHDTVLCTTAGSNVTLTMAQLPPPVVQQVVVKALRVVDGWQVFAWESTPVTYGGEGFRYPVKLPAQLTDIAEEAFLNDMSLTAVYLPDGVKTIGAQAFRDCDNLQVIRIPASVTAIGEDAFAGTILAFAQVAEGSWAANWFAANMPSVELVFE